MNKIRQRLSIKQILDLIVALIGFAVFLLVWLPASVRAEETKLALVTPGDMKTVSLLLSSTENGHILKSPRLAGDYNVTVSGPVAQRFENHSGGYVEGVMSGLI